MENTKPFLVQDLQNFIDKFLTSKITQTEKLIMQSGLFFDCDEEEFEGEEDETLWDATEKKFKMEYRKIQKSLEEICGKAIIEDVQTFEFEDFKLSEYENLGDMISLYMYKDCRFGVLIFQEDAELPMELYVTACRPENL